MTTRAVLYARFSSDLQSAASVEDQFRLGREYAAREGWTVVEEYADRAISGSTMDRPGVTKLLVDARAGKFDVVVTESLDRLSRDLSDIASIYKRMQFAKVKIITLSEGEVTAMHVGLRGTMSQMFLTDLKQKTKRGMRGRVEAGKSGGGLAYGYRKVQKFDSKGEPVRGEREINADEAKVVRQVFEQYARGHSPQRIAKDLNDRKIPSPRGQHGERRGWIGNTILGYKTAPAGILFNEMYRGRLVWNKTTVVTDPDTGTQIARPNPQADWVVTEVPHLRIVSDELWDRVRDRHAATAAATAAIQAKRHPKARTGRGPRYLLSGLLRCATCGASYAVQEDQWYGCSNRRARGPKACSNATRVHKKVAEEKLIAAIKRDLLSDDYLKLFTKTARSKLKRLTSTKSERTEVLQQQLAETERVIGNIARAIKAGIFGETTQAELAKAEADRARLKRELGGVSDGMDNLEAMLPRAKEKFERLVRNLERALVSEVNEARRIVGALVGGQIPLRPTAGGGLQAELSGSYAALVSLLASNGKSTTCKVTYPEREG